MNKRITILLLLMISFSFSATLAERTVKSLNGEWLFCVDSLNKGAKVYPKGLPSNATKVLVPHTWNIMNGLEDYKGLAWYEYSLPIPDTYKGNALPSYAVKGYNVVYENKILPLPLLRPGEIAEIELPEETKQFSIERPTGYNVLTHKIYK